MTSLLLSAGTPGPRSCLSNPEADHEREALWHAPEHALPAAARTLEASAPDPQPVAQEVNSKPSSKMRRQASTTLRSYLTPVPMRISSSAASMPSAGLYGR